MRSFVLGLLGLALVMSVSGCSGGKVKKYQVSGKLTKGGSPLPAPPSGGPPAAGAFAKGIQLAFIPFNEDGTKPTDAAKTMFARVEDDGTYVVDGGLPAGKYVVTVKHSPRGPSTEDTLGDRFNLARSPIVAEITDDTNFPIELDKFK